MIEEKLNKRFEIPLEKIEELINISINGDLQGYTSVVSPKNLASIHCLTFMQEEILERLIKKIPLRSDEKNKSYPYENVKIRVFCREPRGCDVGQTFVSKQKILDIMTNLQNRLFSGFSVNGISKMPPTIIYGRDYEERKVVAFYLPPFIEIHANNAILIDGMHRNMICHSAGASINAIHLSNVECPLPFDYIPWGEIKMVDTKPQIEQRYINLKREYFRDLVAVGIDG